VLVLDAETRTALATVRSLGKHGYEIGLVGSSRSPLAASSAFGKIYFRGPSPREDGQDYLRFLLELIERWRPFLVLPVTDLSVRLTLSVQDRIRAFATLPLVSPDTLQSVTDKYALMRHASGLGIPVPETFLIPSIDERTSDDVLRIKRFPYPAVLKPQTSESAIGESFVRSEVYYPRNADEALSLVSVSTVSANSKIPFLLQQKIEGPGIGVFALCVNGRAGAVFCHRRVLEKPPSGGISVLSESIPENAAPVAEACRLLESLFWDGVAMVEFKQHIDGKFYLMEINPRLWGSLQLAIDSGRDFPRYLAEVYSGKPDENIAALHNQLAPYSSGLRLRWSLGLLDHFFIRLKRSPLTTLADVIFRDALHLLPSRGITRDEIFRRKDPRPFLSELRAYVLAIFSPGRI